MINQVHSLLNILLANSRVQAGNDRNFFNFLGSMGEKNLVNATADDEQKFAQAYAKLHKTIIGDLSANSFRDLIMPKVFYKAENQEEFSKHEAKTILGEFKKLTKKTYSVFRDVRGFELPADMSNVSIGIFTFHNCSIASEVIRSISDKTKLKTPFTERHKYLIECKVRTYDANTALELADKYFESLQNTISFLKRHRNFNLGIKIGESQNIYHSYNYIFCDNLISYGTEVKNHYFPLDLHKKIALRHNSLDNKLITYIGNPDNTQLQNSILSSAMWCGQAVEDKDIASAFMKGSIALETITVKSEHNVTAQIKNFCALILGQSRDGCLAFEKLAGELYRKRCQIAHEGRSSDDLEDCLDDLIMLVYEIISELTYSEIYSKMKSQDEIHAYLESLRYRHLSN